MAKTVLIDSGPLVAALRRRDQHHGWARAHFEATSNPFVTCEAVISECFFLLEKAPRGKEMLSTVLERGVVSVEFSFDAQRTETLRLIRRYDNLPMSFADACLVRMAEQTDAAAIFTTDRDFRTYRRNGRQVIPLIFPE